MAPWGARVPKDQKLFQVFVGCPFRKAIRKNYDQLKVDLEKETPLHVVLADTAAITSTDYLLEHITQLISESACCVFDATGGNPNVSLEVGIAHAWPTDFVLTFNTRKPRTRAERKAESDATHDGEVKPIINDLQGRNRIEYKNYKNLKKQLSSRYLSRMAFTQRWQSFERQHSAFVPAALDVFRDLRRGRALRSRVATRLSGTGIGVDDLLDALVGENLVEVRVGRTGGIFYPKK
jgi:hypothetical protein